MNELFKMVGIGVIAFLLGAVTAISFGGGILPGLFGDSAGTQISVDELRAAHRQSQAVAELAERENRELTGEIQELRAELKRSHRYSRELREQIEGIGADNQTAQESTRGLEKTNRRFGELIEKIEAQAD